MITSLGAAAFFNQLAMLVVQIVLNKSLSLIHIFKREFAAINADASVDGILMLRPLPKQINEQDIEKMIDPAKDLDGISPVNIAKVFSGDTSGFAPCTAVSYTHLDVYKRQA